MFFLLIIICYSLAIGFKNAESASINVLSDVIKQYIETLGDTAHRQAELAHRSFAGIQDCVTALETIRTGPSNSRTHWNDLQAFAFGKNATSSTQMGWYQPFPVEIEKFPSNSVDSSFQRSADYSFLDNDSRKAGSVYMFKANHVVIFDFYPPKFKRNHHIRQRYRLDDSASFTSLSTHTHLQNH